jgi:hypothetical protein
VRSAGIDAAFRPSLYAIYSLLSTYNSMIKFFPLAIFALLIFKGFGHQGCHATVSERLPNPGIISLIFLVSTPFAICQDKKT